MVREEYDFEVRKPFLSSSRVLVMTDFKTHKPLASLNFNEVGKNDETGEINATTSELRAKKPEHAKILLDEAQNVFKALALKGRTNVLHSHLVEEEFGDERKMFEDADYLKTQEIEDIATVLRFNKRIFHKATDKAIMEYWHNHAAMKLFSEVGL